MYPAKRQTIDIWEYQKLQLTKIREQQADKLLNYTDVIGFLIMTYEEKYGKVEVV